MSNKQCFLTDKSDCDLTDLTVDGKTYWIDENVADEHPLKKLKDMVREKLLEIEKNREEALSQIVNATKALGISKEDLGRFLLGQEKKAQTSIDKEEPVEEKPVEQLVEHGQSNKSQKEIAKINGKKEDDFMEVDGQLKSEIRANVSADSKLPSALPAYSTLKDGEGKTIQETNKKVKQLDDGGIVEKSDMGTTVIRMEPKSGSDIDRMLRQVDDSGNLTRAAVSGRGFLSGARTIDCNLCQGSGITRIGYKSCPKCGGTGTITV